jgi:hypothetical protein
MNPTDWLPGMAAVLATATSFLFSGSLLRRLLMESWTGPPALLATLTIAVSLMVVVSGALGVIGLLTRPSLLVTALLVLAICVLISHQQKKDLWGGDRSESPGRRVTAPVAIAVGALLLVCLEWVVPTLNSLEAGMYGGDTLWYHMPFSAHFAQTGSITGFAFVDTQYLNWFYPQNSELIHAAFMVLLGSDFLSPVINYFWLALAVLAGWCIGRPFGMALPASLSVSLLMAMETISARQPGNANNDAMVIALLLAAIAIAATARESGDRTGDGNRRFGFRPGSGAALAISGLALGLATGTKLTALAPALVLLAGFIFLIEPGRRLRIGSLMTAAAALTGGFWFLRNLIATGNPFPWLSAGPFEKAGELTGREPKPVIDYLTDPSVWGEWLAPGLSDRLGPFWLVLLLAALVGIVLGFASRDRLRIVIASAGVAALAAYLFIPLGAAGPEGSPTAFSVNVRYITPALALGFVSLALPVRWTDARTWLIGISWFFLLALGLSFVAVGGLDLEGYPFFGVLAALLVLAVLPGAAIVLWSLGLRGPTAATAVIWLVGLIALGSFQFDRYTDFRYSSDSPRYPDRTYPAAELALGIGPLNDFTRDLVGQRIGLSGSLAQYYQYGVWGPRASNEVEAIGLETETRDLDAPRSCRQWIEALREGRYDLVVTSPPVPDRDPLSVTTAVEDGWIGMDSADLVLSSNRLAVWELDDRSTEIEICTATNR